MSALDAAWYRRCEEMVPAFLKTVKLGSQPGRYLPCARGATPEGREMSLAWGCFALKTLHVVRKWDDLDREEREGWVDFLQDFQLADEEGAFEDPPEMAYLNKAPTLVARLLRLVGRGPWRPEAHSILLAETKQAIATLAEVGAKARRPFRGYPNTPEGVRQWLEALDWSKPWGAGGQSAGLAVFLVTQAPAIMDPAQAAELVKSCSEFLTSLADPETGAYFRGERPAQGELVNGAMKVLMALDWLGVPIHHPDRLIETTLAAPPKREGCHLVDAIYVLHRALGKRPADERIRKFCEEVGGVIREHEHPRGGFSFYPRKAQTNYYGVPISKGLAEPDVQGTCLLTWAAAMIWQMCDPAQARWATLKP